MSGLLLFLTGSILFAQEATLIVNGSFEEGPEPRSFTNLAGGTTSIRGWVVTGEGIDYIGKLWGGSTGQRSVDLDGSKPSKSSPPYAKGGVAQTFATRPGARYRVTFDLAGNPLQRPAVKPLRVSAADEQIEFTFDVTGRSPGRMGWTTKTWSFTAKDSSTTLEFWSLTQPPLTGYGAAIDNVHVTAEDEPQMRSEARPPQPREATAPAPPERTPVPADAGRIASPNGNTAPSRGSTWLAPSSEDGTTVRDAGSGTGSGSGARNRIWNGLALAAALAIGLAGWYFFRSRTRQ